MGLPHDSVNLLVNMLNRFYNNIPTFFIKINKYYNRENIILVGIGKGNFLLDYIFRYVSCIIFKVL